MDELRALLIAARKAKNLSVASVARLLGVQRATVYRWEDGSRAPDVETLRRWADAVGVEVRLVVTAPPETTPTPTPEESLIRRLQALAGSLDANTLRLLDAQLAVLESERVKKVS